MYPEIVMWHGEISVCSLWGQ